MIISVSFFGL
jgi:hypothetical protein